MGLPVLSWEFMIKTMNMKIEEYQDFIFDFDGVIVDSVNVKTEAFAQLYKPFGEDVVSKVIAHHLAHGGVSRYEKIPYYHKQYLNKDISNSEVLSFAKQYSNLVVQRVLDAPFIEGAIEFLGLLKNSNKRMFIISATPEDEIKDIVLKRNLHHYFIDVKGAPRAKKENIAQLIRTYSIDISKCVYFGDSKQDFEAASLLNIFFVPINYRGDKKGYKDFGELIDGQTRI